MSQVRDPPNTGDGKVTCLDELPTDWWTVVDNASGGYQYKTLTEICGARVESMLDGCAGLWYAQQGQGNGLEAGRP